MSIRGTLEKKETNTYGYTTVWVSKTRYGADKKGPIPAEVGDQVEFEAFEKAGTGGSAGRTFPTVQLSTFRKLPSDSQSVPSANTGNGAAPTVNTAGAYQSRDSYWGDKAVEDAKKDPRIVFQSSYERALIFAKLAIDTKCFEALEKAKPTARLEVLTAFVDEQAARIFKAVYAAEVPKVEERVAVAAPAEELEPLLEQEWS